MSKLLTVKILNLWKQPASTWIPYINAGTTIAYFHLLEKGKNPIEAIKASNDATCGNKWSLFGDDTCIGKTALWVVFFFVSRQRFYRKTINIIFFSDNKSYICCNYSG